MVQANTTANNSMICILYFRVKSNPADTNRFRSHLFIKEVSLFNWTNWKNLTDVWWWHQASLASWNVLKCKFPVAAKGHVILLWRSPICTTFDSRFLSHFSHHLPHFMTPQESRVVQNGTDCASSTSLNLT